MHGTATCLYGDKGLVCFCPPGKPSPQFNYEFYYSFVLAIKTNKMHLTISEERWKDFATMLFGTQWIKYIPITGKNLKPKWFKQVILDVQKRHDFGKNSKAREAHPEITPFDKLVME